jgi:MFS family permease
VAPQQLSRWEATVFGRKTHHDDAHADTRAPGYSREAARERYGGFSFAAAFFGWLVAVALTVLLVGIAGAVATAAGASLNIAPAEAEQEAGTIGLAGAVTLLVILMIAYFAGGYVAGRMSRFDGGRQGLGAWLIGLLVTILVGLLGAVAGAEYDIFARVSLPSLPVSTETLTFGGVIALAAILLGTLLAAMLGGKAGQRYHTKVDRAATV